MKNNYKIVNIISTADEIELKEKINSIVRTLCTEDIRKMSSIDYNMDISYGDGFSEFYEKEGPEQC